MFFKAACNGSGHQSLSLVDIGANVGLFTRQAYNICNQSIRKLWCYEPEPINYRLLKNNLNYMDNSVRKLFNIALAKEDGHKTLYLSDDNHGSYSLLAEALEISGETNNKTSKKTVLCKQAKEVAMEWSTSELPIFYKSDAEGFDECIALEVPFEIWKNQIFGGIIELKGVKGKDTYIDSIVPILELFKNKVLASKHNVNLSTNDLVESVKKVEKLGKSINVYFWK